MVKRLFLSSFLAVVACGMSFYVANFVGLMYVAASRQLSSNHYVPLQWWLRHTAFPFSVALGMVVFWCAFRRLGQPGAGRGDRTKKTSN